MGDVEDCAFADSRAAVHYGATQCSPRASQIPALTPVSLGGEAVALLQDAAPIVLANLLEYIPLLLMLVFVGHLPRAQDDLAATALGRSYFNACFSISWGLTSALHTLAPQAEGAGRRDLHALHCQRACVFLTAACVPLTLLQVYSGSIMVALGQAASVSMAAQPFAIRCIGRLFAESYFTILQRVGQAMGLASPLAALAAVGFVAAILFLWLFIDVAKLGYLGAAWACSAWNTLNLVLLAAFLVAREESRHLLKPYKPFKEVLSLEGLYEYASLAVPATLQTCLEWWIIDLGVMLGAGRLPNAEVNLGACAILASVGDTCYMVWCGLQGAVSIAVGKHVGAGDAEGALRTVRVSLGLGLCCALPVFSALLAGRFAIAAALTDDVLVREKAAQSMVVSACIALTDSSNAVMGGVLRGMGHQQHAAAFQFAGFYVVGVPAACALFWMFHDTSFGLAGLWVAVACAGAASSALSAVHVARVDWETVLSEARERNQ